MPKDALKFAVGIILTIAFLSIVIVLTNKGLSAAKNAEKQYDNMIASTSSEYAIYDNTTVTGSQVITAIRTLGNDVTLYVGTKANPLVVNGHNVPTAGVGATLKSYQTDASNTAQAKYEADANSDSIYKVNETAAFSASLVINSNNVVTGIVFQQQ